MSLRQCIFVMIAATSTCATQAFEQETHIAITDKILKQLKPRLADGTELTFSKQRRAEIAQQNADTDSRRSIDPRLHFDSEEMEAGAKLAFDNRTSVVTRLRTGAANHQMILGQLLHATQDFYSHSTWIEQGNGGSIARLSDAERDPKLLPKNQIGLVCDSDATNVRGSEVSTGYFKLLRGFFNLIGLQHDDAPPPLGKCKHGLKRDDASLGINKDRPPTFDSSGRHIDGSPIHDIAVELAERATEDVLKKIIRELEDARDDAALCRLTADLRNCSNWIYRFENSISAPFAPPGVPFEETTRIRRYAANASTPYQDVTVTEPLGTAGRAQIAFLKPDANTDVELRVCRRGDKWLPFTRSYSITGTKDATTFSAYNLVSCPTQPIGTTTAPFTIRVQLTEAGILTVTRFHDATQDVQGSCADGFVYRREDLQLKLDLPRGGVDFHYETLHTIDIRNHAQSASDHRILEITVRKDHADSGAYDVTLTSGAFERISGTVVESELGLPADCNTPLVFCPEDAPCAAPPP